MYFVQHTQRGQANLNQQTFSQYSQWKKCSTKWRKYEFTAEKVGNKSFKHSNGTLPAFVFLSVYFVELTQRENTGKHMKHKAQQAPHKEHN